MIANDATYKPSIEFYADAAMGLCVIVTEKDGRQRTKQYLADSIAFDWLEEWLEARAAVARAEEEA